MSCKNCSGSGWGNEFMMQDPNLPCPVCHGKEVVENFNQRRFFADFLLEKIRDDNRLFLLVGDLGYKVFDEHFKEFPQRCINTGAAEQALLDIAVGLAYDGKIPVCYTITPFLLRGFETIRTYINHEILPVKMVGSGRDDDYKHDGFSHNASDIKDIFDTQKEIIQYYPNNKEDISEALSAALSDNNPSFISLKR